MTERDRKFNELRQPDSLIRPVPAYGQQKARFIGGAIIGLLERLSLAKSGSDIDPDEPTCLDQRLAMGLPIDYGKECGVPGCNKVREKILGLVHVPIGDCPLKSMPSRQE